MAGTDTPWARLDQTFAFQGSDDDEEGDGGLHGYGYDGGGEGSRKGSVATIVIGHEPQPQSLQYQQQQQYQQHQQPQHHSNNNNSNNNNSNNNNSNNNNSNNNTHHRTATTLTTSTTSTASTITPANAGQTGHQRQASQLSTSTQQQQQQQQHQQHRPRPSLDEQYATKPLPPVPQKGRLQKSASSRSSRPSDKHHHRSQPSTSSLASSVSSFNVQPGGAADAGGFASSSLTRGGSVSSPTTLLRPAQSSAGWFSSASQHRPQQKEAAPAGRIVIEPPALAPLDLPPLTAPPTHTLLAATASNSNARPITPLAQPPLMAPLALPPLKPRSRGSGAPSFSSSHLPTSPRTAPHGDAVSLFSVRSMGSVNTTTAASAQNSATRDDTSSMYSERRVPTNKAKHSSSLPSLSSFSSASRLKPAAAVPGKAVRKFMRMAGKAASSAKDAMKGPLHTHNNGSTPSVGSHSAGGTPSITVTTPVPSPMMSPMVSPRPPHSSSGADPSTAIKPTMVPRRRSMSKISQLTGMDVGGVGGGSTGVSNANVGALRRSQSADTPMGRGHAPRSSASSASNVPASKILSPTLTTASAPTPSIWNTSTFNSDDENDSDEKDDEYTVDDGISGRESSISSRSPVPSSTADDTANAADIPDPATASLLRSLSQTSTQPPQVFQPMPRLQPSQQTSPSMASDHQRTLLPPNRLLKIKRYSDPTMAPIIEHPDDTSNPSGSNSSRASSRYSTHEANITPEANEEDAAAFIPSRPAPVPVRSPSPTPVASPTQASMLSLTIFPTVPSISATTLAKHIPTIRLFPSSADNQASATSPVSPSSATASPITHSSSSASAPRKIPLPTSSDISNPWPTSPPPRPPPPPPLHPINASAPETEAVETPTEVAEKRLSGTGSSAMFRTVQWGQMADQSRSSSSTPTGNRLSLHARTKSNGSASESIATSIATSVANSSTSGSSALSSTVASTIGSSNRSAGFGSFSSASTASNRHSYQLQSPPLPPPPPSYPLPPLPTTTMPLTAMPMTMSPPTQSAFDHDDDEGGARMMAARMMKKAASRDSVRWRPTALGKSFFRRESSPGPGGSSSPTNSGPTSQASTSQPTSGGGLRSSLSTRSSLSATTLLAAQRVAQTTRKAVEAVSESSGGSSSAAARQHELEMEKWREDLRSRIRMIPEGGEVAVASEAPMVQGMASPPPVPAPAPPLGLTSPTLQQQKPEVQATVHEIRNIPPIHDNNNSNNNGFGGMI